VGFLDFSGSDSVPIVCKRPVEQKFSQSPPMPSHPGGPEAARLPSYS
jgi:hypothetical protein